METDVLGLIGVRSRGSSEFGVKEVDDGEASGGDDRWLCRVGLPLNGKEVDLTGRSFSSVIATVLCVGTSMRWSALIAKVAVRRRRR